MVEADVVLMDVVTAGAHPAEEMTIVEAKLHILRKAVRASQPSALL